jgi:hypothetical protein
MKDSLMGCCTKASRALICFAEGTQPKVRGVRQGVQVNSVVLGDGKVFMRRSDVHRTSSACLRDPPPDYVAQRTRRGLLGYE